MDDLSKKIKLLNEQLKQILKRTEKLNEDAFFDSLEYEINRNIDWYNKGKS